MHTALDPETSVQYTEGNSFLCSFNDTKDFAKLKSSACAVKGMIINLDSMSIMHFFR